mgnify:CR=1 FL=1
MNALTSSDTVVMRGEGLNKSFGGQTILKDASFTMRRGEVILLRGPNGSGKTTLLNMLTGNLQPDSGTLQIFGEHAGTAFRFPQGSIAAANPFNRFSPEGVAHEGLSRTWQDIRLFPTHTLRENVVLAIKRQLGERFLPALFRPGAVKREQARLAADADALLQRFGLAGRENSSGDMVSLGQSKRVAIARTVQAGAHIVLLDEPLAALDGKGIDDVLGMLREMVAQHGTTLLIVEHVFNIPRILDLATTVWTLKDGKIVSENPADVREEAAEQSTDVVGPWLASLADGAEVREQLLPGGARLSSIRLTPEGAGDVLLSVEDLIVRRGRRPVVGRADAQGRVQGLSFRVERGTVAVLHAPNGWGKTTLLDALSGVIPPSSGRIVLKGGAVQNLPTWERVRRGLSIMQSRDNAFPNLTVDESLALAGLATPPETVVPFLGKTVSQLSGGQRQKVAAACAMANPAGRVLLLDEPFSMLDKPAIAGIQEAIAANRDGATLILLPAPSQG